MDTKIPYFQEYERFNSKKVESLFSQEQIKNLFEKNILKSEKEKIYYFNYVGLVCSGEEICIVLPKYLSRAEIREEEHAQSPKSRTKLLMKIFKTYSSKNLNESYLSLTGEQDISEQVNLFALYDYLISDFIEYGLYENQKDIYERNGEGEIDWEKTVNECESFLTGKKKPVYLEYFTHETETDNSSYIRILHKHYLNKASGYFEELSFLGLDYPVLSFDIEEEDLENLEFQIFKIQRELQEEFSERKIRLLKTLLILLENESHETEKSLSFYGTTAFYDVWEKACGSVLGNQYDKYKGHISRPIWKDSRGNSFEKETLRPDILVVRKDYFFIFDAKYYNPDLTDEKGLPGVESITKQYLYELAFMSHIDYSSRKRRNIFLIPWNGRTIEYEGEVSISFLKRIGDVELQDILLYKFPAEVIFELYINSKILADNDYEKLENWT